MSRVSFVKYQGTGNDFILVDDRLGNFSWDASLIRSLCHRQRGVGADGVILLGEVPPDFTMRIFNSDGGEAESCGNGLRCLAQFLKDLGIVRPAYRIRTQGGIANAFFRGKHPAIDLGVPKEIRLGIETPFGPVHCIDMGVPHAVHFVPDVQRIDVRKKGAALRKLLGANVDFASLRSDGSIEARTFERGVEGETLSCGTGAAAIGAVAKQIYRLKEPIPIRFPGGELLIWEEEGRMVLSGPAEKVFTGSI